MTGAVFVLKNFRPGFTGKEVAVESSICTGETHIGLREADSGRLLEAEVKDIAGFCRRHRLKRMTGKG